MSLTGFTNISYDNIQQFRKKAFMINKLEKSSVVPNLKQKMKILFAEPESYLKLPHETHFNFVIGKHPKGPRLNSDKNLIPYTVVGIYSKKDQRKLTRQKSIVNSNNSSSSSFPKKAKTFTKYKTSPISFNENKQKEKDKEEKKKKFPNISDVNHLQIFGIFNETKKRILKNKSEIINNSILKEIPKLMHPYINEPLSQQERALKNNQRYKNILNNIEHNISKAIKNKKKTQKYYNISKSYENYNESNLMRYSGTEYRMKVEKINLTEKKKTPNLILNNPIQNWEMSLRRPKNFIGERKEYLNIRTDQNPYWAIITEKNPFENEKIISSNINNMNKKNYYKNFYNTNYLNKSVKPLDLTSGTNFTKDINNIINPNNLEIKGRKLIDEEEKNIRKMKGNIKLLNLKYDRESLKDITFKRNLSINNYSLYQN